MIPFTKEELEAWARELVNRRVEFSGEDEAPGISHIIDKELIWALKEGYELARQHFERKWISVHDQLPDFDQPVWTDKGFLTREDCNSAEPHPKFPQLGTRKYVTFDFDWGWKSEWGATHNPDYVKLWQPLPEAP